MRTASVAAAITAKRVTNPRVNVGRASLIGTGASALLYVLVTAAVMGLVPQGTLVSTGAPFVDAFQAMFPGSAWAGTFIAAIAVISGIGALNGWIICWGATDWFGALGAFAWFPWACSAPSSS